MSSRELWKYYFVRLGSDRTIVSENDVLFGDTVTHYFTLIGIEGL